MNKEKYAHISFANRCEMDFSCEGRTLSAREAVLFAISTREHDETLSKEVLGFVIYNCKEVKREYEDWNLFDSFKCDGWHVELSDSLSSLFAEGLIDNLSSGYALKDAGREKLQRTIRIPVGGSERLRELITQAEATFALPTSDFIRPLAQSK